MISLIFCFRTSLMIPHRSFCPRTSASAKWHGLIHGNLARQGGLVGIDDGLDHGRPRMGEGLAQNLFGLGRVL